MVNQADQDVIRKLMAQRKVTAKAGTQAPPAGPSHRSPALDAPVPNRGHKRRLDSTFPSDSDGTGAILALGSDTSSNDILQPIKRGRALVHEGLLSYEREDSVLESCGKIFEHLKKAHSEMERVKKNCTDQMASKDLEITFLKSQLGTAHQDKKALEGEVRVLKETVTREKKTAQDLVISMKFVNLCDGFENCRYQVKRGALDVDALGYECDLVHMYSESLPDPAVIEELLPPAPTTRVVSGPTPTDELSSTSLASEVPRHALPTDAFVPPEPTAVIAPPPMLATEGGDEC